MAWNPNFSGEATALTVSGSLVYVRGYFTSIGGQPRNRIAALNASTGNATDWDPNAGGGANPVVRSTLVNGSTVYVGGEFTTIGGQSRTNLAALNATSGFAAPGWNPNVTGATFPVVLSMKLIGSNLYVGGQFDHVGGLTRNNLAAVDTASGAPTPWNPNANGFIYPMLVRGSTLIVGGGFTSVGVQARENVAEIDLASGMLTAFEMNADNAVVTLAAGASSLYMGGYFDNIDYLPQRRLAAADIGSVAPFRTLAAGTMWWDCARTRPTPSFRRPRSGSRCRARTRSRSRSTTRQGAGWRPCWITNGAGPVVTRSNSRPPGSPAACTSIASASAVESRSGRC